MITCAAAWVWETVRTGRGWTEAKASIANVLPARPQPSSTSSVSRVTR